MPGGDVAEQHDPQEPELRRADRLRGPHQGAVGAGGVLGGAVVAVARGDADEGGADEHEDRVDRCRG